MRPAVGKALAVVATCGTLACTSAPPNLPPAGTLLPPDEGKVQVSADIAYSYKELIAVPAVGWAFRDILDKSLDKLHPFQYPMFFYYVYQPFAPNWRLEEAKLSEDTYYVRMQAKRFRTGGDGEAMMLMKRRASQLQHERGYAGYRVIDYNEGIESSTPIAQRFGEGIFRLVRAAN